MSSLIVDLESLYFKTFGSNPYKVPGISFNDDPEQPYAINKSKELQLFDKSGSQIQTSYRGVEIWLPTRFRGLPIGQKLFSDSTLLLPYTVVRITGTNTFERTPVLESHGTVKEYISTDDYKISIKGFFIDRNRVWPYDDLLTLRKLHNMGSAFYLDNALTNVFLANDRPGEQFRAVITGFDLPEVEGGRKHVRPFSLQIESDFVDTLEWKG